MSIPIAERAVIRQHSERSANDEARQFLAAGHVAHVGFESQGQPYVIPFSYHYSEQRPDRLYLHGGASSRTLSILAGGARVCVTVTELDGLVFSKTALNHSMNYRSVVCFGRATTVSDEAIKNLVFIEMIDRYFPNRQAPRDYALPTPAQLQATALLEVHIEELSAKARRGGPTGPLDNQPDAPGTCGVVPL